MSRRVANRASVGCILGACLAMGCSGRVDLGGGASGAPAAPITSEVEVAAQTTGLMKMNAISVVGLAVDDTYLYLMSFASVESSSYYLQRCKKADCWRSLTSLTKLWFRQSSIQLSAGQLGWINDQGLHLCRAPECRDVEVVQGATFDFDSPGPVVWDQSFAYWFLQADKSIYRCSLPNCASGPEFVASNAQVLDMTLAGEKLYWLDQCNGILRTTTNGAAQTERLTLQEQTAWVPSNFELPRTRGSSAFRFAIEGPFVYSAVRVDEPCANGSRTNLASAGTDLVRWRHADTGAPRELLLTADPSFDSSTFVRLFDGEVVWGTEDGRLWSCLAENCTNTKRQFGVDGSVDYGRSMASDEQYIYWLSGRCEGTGNCPDVWNLKRTPRIPK